LPAHRGKIIREQTKRKGWIENVMADSLSAFPHEAKRNFPAPGPIGPVNGLPNLRPPSFIRRGRLCGIAFTSEDWHPAPMHKKQFDAEFRRLGKFPDLSPDERV
jgi:hypothetical protein